MEKKALHSQYPKLLEKAHIDIVTTNKWLSSNLEGETEELLVAAQDQTLNTRNYQKVICGQKVESNCRMCSQHEETVDHIVSGCEVLAKTEYISRHNNAAAYLHWNSCQDHDIAAPAETVIKEINNNNNNNNNIRRKPENNANKVDIAVMDKEKKTKLLIEGTVCGIGLISDRWKTNQDKYRIKGGY